MHSAIRRRTSRRGSRGAGLLVLVCALAAFAPAAVAEPDPVPPAAARAHLPAVPTAPDPTTQVQNPVTGTGDHVVTIPVGATAMTATVYGKAGPGAQGGSVTGSVGVAPNSPVTPGSTLIVRIADQGTSLSPAATSLTWLFAPAAGGLVAYVDRAVFPAAQISATGGTGEGHAMVTFTVPAATVAELPATIDFGAVPLGQSATRNLPIGTSGGVPFMIAGATADGPFAIDGNGTTCASGPDTNVPGGSSCSFAIVFTPTKRGSGTGTLTLTGNVPGGSRTVALTGLGSGKPGAPGGLSATAGQGQVVLSWMPPADTGDSPITGYRIHRSTNGEVGSTAPLTSLAADTLTYTDQGLENGTTYTYAVSATNAVGESNPSAPVDGAPAAALVLPSAALPPGTVGRPYTATLAAQGGTAPYHWIADEPLPPGLSLDPDGGQITGVPTAAGETAFGVTVSDNAPTKHEAKARFTLTVGAPRPDPADPAQAALTPSDSGGDDGPDVSTWLWVILGLAGLTGVVVALRRLRARRS